MYVPVYIPVKNILTYRYAKVPSTLARAVKLVAFNGFFFLHLQLNQTVCTKWAKVRLYTPDFTLSVSL